MMDLCDEKVAVFGCNGALGSAIVDVCKGYGASVIGFDQASARVDMPIDLDSFDSISCALDRYREALCEITGVVFAHGITKNLAESYGVEPYWESTIAVNLSSHFYIINGLLAICKRLTSVVGISSIATLRGSPNNPAYAASKAGLEGLYRSYANDCGEDGIRFNLVSPGFVGAGMTEASCADPDIRRKRTERLILPLVRADKQVAQACAFLISNHSSLTTGQTLQVDSGWSVKF